MRRYLSWLLCLPLLSFPRVCSAETSDYGVLVLVNGGSAVWRETVKKTVKDAKLPYPVRIFFGQANNREEIGQLQDDLIYLENKKVRTIIAIPLLVSGNTDEYRQWRYLLGIDIKPGFNDNPVFPLQKHANIEFAESLNDDPIMSMVLLDRAREISQNPDIENVILVAQGAKYDVDMERYRTVLKNLSDDIRQRGRFRSVIGLMLRDDAGQDIRQATYEVLRARVEALNRTGGKVLIIPLVLQPSGMNNKIGATLKGLEYTLNGRSLLPDQRLSQWLRSKAP